MGIFGWIGRKARAVAAAISRGYKSFSGQATFEEADRLYDDVMKRFEEHKKYYNKEVKKLSSQIQKFHIWNITDVKRCIITTPCSIIKLLKIFNSKHTGTNFSTRNTGNLRQKT